MQAERVIGRYAIGGAVAASLYIEPAETEDIDVFVGLKPSPGQIFLSLEPIYRYASSRNWEIVGAHLKIGGWLLQILPPDSLLVEEAIEKAVKKEIDGLQTWVFTAEHIMAIALKLGRPKDKIRLSQFLELSSSSEPKPRFDERVLDSILQRHGLSDVWSRFKRIHAG